MVCECVPAVVTKYQRRIFDPRLDRIENQIEVLYVGDEKLSGYRSGETSESIRKRIQAGKDI